MTLLKDLIRVPDRVHQGDFVLKLTDACNDDDPCSSHSECFVRELAAARVPYQVTHGEGGHSSWAYVANGLMRWAVGFLLESSRGRSGHGPRA